MVRLPFKRLDEKAFHFLSSCLIVSFVSRKKVDTEASVVHVPPASSHPVITARAAKPRLLKQTIDMAMPFSISPDKNIDG